MWKTILSGDIWRGELINRLKNGDLYTEEMSITPVRYLAVRSLTSLPSSRTLHSAGLPKRPAQQRKKFRDSRQHGGHGQLGVGRRSKRIWRVGWLHATFDLLPSMLFLSPAYWGPSPLPTANGSITPLSMRFRGTIRSDPTSYRLTRRIDSGFAAVHSPFLGPIALPEAWSARRSTSPKAGWRTKSFARAKRNSVPWLPTFLTSPERIDGWPGLIHQSQCRAGRRFIPDGIAIKGL